CIMLAGDSRQRVFAMPFDLRGLGFDLSPASRTLTISYRSTEPIRKCAEAIIVPSIDVEFLGEKRRDHARSLRAGPEPLLQGFPGTRRSTDLEFAANTIAQLVRLMYQPSQIGVFHRVRYKLEILENMLKARQVPCVRQGFAGEGASIEGVCLTTMHAAKGLEFRCVFVIGASKKYLPLPIAIEQAALAGADALAAAWAAERSLLYEAMTRAQEMLIITWSGEPSPFLEPLLSAAADNPRSDR
ncbi:MAG: hypothetical protein JNM84_14145, partial [Planctomycetes bacterium]|nr:hypothetical protein [Planctomycetota bacterium]